MCHRDVAEVNSNRAILATLMPSHCHFIIAAAASLPSVICCSSMSSLSLLHCCCAVNQSSSSTSSLSLSCCRWAVKQCSSLTSISSLLRHRCAAHTFIIATSSPSHPHHLAMLLALRKQHCSKGSSCSLPFLSPDGSIIWIIPAMLCCTAECKCLPISTPFVRDKVAMMMLPLEL